MEKVGQGAIIEISLSINDQTAPFIGRKEWVNSINRLVAQKNPCIQTEYVDTFRTSYVSKATFF